MPTRKSVARHGWSGVEEIFTPVIPAEVLDRLIPLFPSIKSDPETLASNLIDLGGSFVRSLHQEIGPRRADQAEGLRDLLKRVEHFGDRCDKNDLRLLADLLDQIDTNASGELVLHAAQFGLVLTDLRDPWGAADAIEKLGLLKQSLDTCISGMSARRGPDAQESLNVFIFKLGVLWKFETGTEPTAHHDSESPFERFAQEAFKLFAPPPTWFLEHLPFANSALARKFAAGKGHARATVRKAIRKTREVPGKARGRPKDES